MANLKSSKKDIRRIERRTERNRSERSRLKTLRTRLKKAEDGGADADTVQTNARELISALDKAAKRGVIHKNKANRHKAECARLFRSE